MISVFSFDKILIDSRKSFFSLYLSEISIKSVFVRIHFSIRFSIIGKFISFEISETLFILSAKKSLFFSKSDIFENKISFFCELKFSNSTAFFKELLKISELFFSGLSSFSSWKQTEIILFSQEFFSQKIFSKKSE